MSIDDLEAEFDRRRPDFVAEHEGRWVLLFESGEARYYDIENDAVSSGLRDRTGNAFVVKRAFTREPVVTLSSAVLTGHGS